MAGARFWHGDRRVGSGDLLDRLPAQPRPARPQSVKLVISDAHEGLKSAIARVLNASWQRCRIHFMRNALAHAGKQGRRVVSAFIGTAFARTMPRPPGPSGAKSPISCARASRRSPS